MKLICDCGATIHDQVQPAPGVQPSGDVFEHVVGILVTVSKVYSDPQRLLEIKCDGCGRVFVRVDVRP